jgi:hypothetical protein
VQVDLSVEGHDLAEGLLGEGQSELVDFNCVLCLLLFVDVELGGTGKGFGLGLNAVLS